MTRHQFSKTHLSAAMLALHATKGAPAKVDESQPLTEEQEVLVLDAARRIHLATACGFDRAEKALLVVLKSEQVRAAALKPTLPPVARFAPQATQKRSRYRGERHPMTSYEHALVERWPNALHGGRRAQNSGEFSILASKLGATDEEIVAMVIAINTRPR
jgi:hypothetical protein